MQHKNEDVSQEGNSSALTHAPRHTSNCMTEEALRAQCIKHGNAVSLYLWISMCAEGWWRGREEGENRDESQGFKQY